MMRPAGPAGWAAGVLLSLCVSIAAAWSATWVGESLLGFDSSPVSAIMMAIIIGMIIANTVRLPGALQPGLRFSASTLLRTGIMLLGIRLSLLGAGKFTLVALPFVVVAITVGVVTVGHLGRRMGLSRRLSGLIAIGTSVCGCTAIVAIAPLIRARESEVSYAVACITLFGLAAMFGYPLLAHWAFSGQPELAGLFLGTSIHETAQVAGAGMMYDAQFGAPVVLDIATVTKLVRNLCMIAIIPLLGVLYGAPADAAGRPAALRPSYFSLVPWFIVGFAAMSAVRTLGDLGDRPLGLLEPSAWQGIVSVVQLAAERLLLVAMAAVGLTSAFAGLREIGLRPFALGLFAAALVGTVSFLLIGAFGEMLLQAIV